MSIHWCYYSVVDADAGHRRVVTRVHCFSLADRSTVHHVAGCHYSNCSSISTVEISTKTLQGPAMAITTPTQPCTEATGGGHTLVVPPENRAPKALKDALLTVLTDLEAPNITFVASRTTPTLVTACATVAVKNASKFTSTRAGSQCLTGN